MQRNGGISVDTEVKRLYEILKKMQITFEDESEDIFKIKDWLTECNLSNLEDACNSLWKQRVEIERLVLNDVCVDAPLFARINVNAASNGNYLIIMKSQADYKAKTNKKIYFPHEDYDMYKCLDTFLGERKKYFLYKGKFVFDIRKYTGSERREIKYLEGNEQDAKKCYDTLNKLLIRVIGKTTQKLKYGVRVDEYRKLEDFLLKTLPAFCDVYTEPSIKDYRDYCEQRFDIRLMIDKYISLKCKHDIPVCSTVDADRYKKLIVNNLNEEKAEKLDNTLNQIDEIGREYFKRRMVDDIMSYIDKIDIYAERFVKEVEVSKYIYGRMTQKEYEECYVKK